MILKVSLSSTSVPSGSSLINWASITNFFMDSSHIWFCLKFNPQSAEIFLWKSKRTKPGFFSIWNHHICPGELFLPYLNTLLWVYGHYKYFYSFSAGTVFIRQNLTYKDGPCTERVKLYIYGPSSTRVDHEEEKIVQKIRNIFTNNMCLYLKWGGVTHRLKVVKVMRQTGDIKRREGLRRVRRKEIQSLISSSVSRGQTLISLTQYMVSGFRLTSLTL